jgi:endonuclease YncB( thermonuclease family)
MGGWGPILVLGVLVGAVLDARAEGSPSRCGADPMPAGHVARVIDGRSFLLDDGREIRLAALEVPPMAEASPAGPAARTALAALLAGESVELRSAASAPDRYGRILAHAFTAREPRPVAHAMLAAGHARVGAPIGHPACAAELLSQERVARTAKLGLWADPRYGILDAGNLAGLVSGRGRFTVAEGRVVSVRESGGTIYVNFGRRWSQALTVTISKRHERIFSDAGRSPRALENKRVRVRGWVEIRNGPRIEASRPEQIELAEAN